MENRKHKLPIANSAIFVFAKNPSTKKLTILQFVLIHFWIGPNLDVVFILIAVCWFIFQILQDSKGFHQYRPYLPNLLFIKSKIDHVHDTFRHGDSWDYHARAKKWQTSKLQCWTKLWGTIKYWISKTVHAKSSGLKKESSKHSFR